METEQVKRLKFVVEHHCGSLLCSNKQKLFFFISSSKQLSLLRGKNKLEMRKNREMMPKCMSRCMSTYHRFINFIFGIFLCRKNCNGTCMRLHTGFKRCRIDAFIFCLLFHRITSFTHALQ